jgi:pyruvate/2-oxoglutarate dehydrogenase complex dihydrolipoamide acyltransferase (E2) component
MGEVEHMRTVVRMPNLGAEAAAGRIVNWLRQVGDVVAVGDPIAEVETDKATVELEALAPGRLVEIVAPAGAEVQVGGTLAFIAEE